ncbi:MAG: pyridoxamine 5'-phosphate oxidase family protein [Pseudomonadales bacterium]|jgi:pyridoxine/pyridoxamine 5'-phosphate oxidase|nr:pyridoxamine 5'-phosphate oxidase family protein [Pseudomonadales bacterium]MDP6470949.1 pyridoxamine 5'-phosphate oxidase family protein [Pseudomonadales bacterium]MDP6825866.1 pyridoxamine 5'-phosphate oxidase family protein [Pseudomonadales bacterium]MDP6972834.1 pyridoxamine 5'-phosphate oxidase family protein [Pseudomonadales bacterium]|tara:strand:- start:3110 stop:3679 length:570 start_codon:yes stop_codon:yes gene_type:complete
MDPLELLFEDRARAREADDPWANLCALASIDANGRPQVRTLVLRELAGRLGVFVNSTSPKWQQIRAGEVAISMFYANPNVQYRLHCETEEIPEAIVRESWLLRPPMPQRMDWFYPQHAQSSLIENREALVKGAMAVSLPDPLRAPETARGVYLEPRQIDRLDLAQENGIHDRRAWHLNDGRWHERTLVP